MNKRIATLATATGLAGVATFGVVQLLPGPTGADTTTTAAGSTTSGSSSSSTNSNSSTSGTNAPNATKPNGTAPARDQWIKDAIAGLVKNGTITQQQADAVVGAIDNAKPKPPPFGHRSPGPAIGRLAPGSSVFDAAAKAIGITSDDLKTQLQGGKSIATVANDHKVDPQKVIDAMVGALPAAPTNLTPDQKTQFDQRRKDAITNLVNGTFKFGPGKGGPRFPGPFGGRGPFGGNRPNPANPPSGGSAPSSSSTTTA